MVPEAVLIVALGAFAWSFAPEWIHAAKTRARIRPAREPRTVKPVNKKRKTSEKLNYNPIFRKKVA